MAKSAPKSTMNPTPVGRIKPVKSNTGDGGFEGSTKVPTTQTPAAYSGGEGRDTFNKQ